MDSRAAGEECNQLARLLFSAAATKWYTAAILEIVAVLLSGVLSFAPLPDPLPLVGALAGIALLVIAYGLRIAFDGQYDRAETMRRQAAFSEGMGWPIEPWQMDTWRQRAGKKIRSQYQAKPRDPNYYATTRETGPRRLAEMTIESAFYTWQLYARLHDWAIRICIAAAVALGAIALVTALKVLPGSIDVFAARALLVFIPVVLTANVLAWALQLARLVDSICEIQRDLEHLSREEHPNEGQVLRLVSEYNCQVATGIPVLDWFFNRWHGEIDDLWNQRQRSASPT